MTTDPTRSPINPRRASYPQQFRAAGAILGAAIGDALGAPFEFGPGGQFGARFPGPVIGGVGEMIGGGGFGWAPGEFTDDTQMAMALAESLIRNDGLDLDDLWERFRAWAQSAKDVGIVTSGCPSPTLGASIAMGFLDKDLLTPGTAVEIDTGKGATLAAKVHTLPFYKAPKPA